MSKLREEKAQGRAGGRQTFACDAARAPIGRYGGARRRTSPEALNFSGRRFRQFGDEFDLARIFVMREAILYEFLQRGLIRLAVGTQHHESLGLDPQGEDCRDRE